MDVALFRICDNERFLKDYVDIGRFFVLFAQFRGVPFCSYLGWLGKIAHYRKF